MFITPNFEIRTADEDVFLSMAEDMKSYRYLAGQNTMKTGKMTAKASKMIALATYLDGSVLYMNENGTISKEQLPIGL